MLKHINWLKDTETITTISGKPVRVLEFCYVNNDDIALSEWAKHFRNHYCSDSQIDALRAGTGYSRAEYLVNIKFPDETADLGPSIRSGDFAEILIADYLEHLLGYSVPRTRYRDKTIRNESQKGSDVIGFKILQKEKFNHDDTLAIYEVKAALSAGKTKNKLQEAVNGSIIDNTRKGESLNAIKQRLLDLGATDFANEIGRFQNPTDHPYKEISGAAAVFSSSSYDSTLLTTTDTKDHPNQDNLYLVIIHGKEMMKLVHALYRRAADEA